MNKESVNISIFIFVTIHIVRAIPEFYVVVF